MFWKSTQFLLVVVFLCACSVGAQADTLPVGVFSYDDLSLGVASATTFGLDVANFSGPFGGSAVVTALSFENVSVVLTFADGSSGAGPGLFSDGVGGFTTGEAFAGGSVVSALLTGTFSTSVVTLDDGSTVAIDHAFSVSLTDPFGPLADGDFALINVNTSPIITGAAEPGTLVSLFLGLAFAGMLALFRK